MGVTCGSGGGIQQCRLGCSGASVAGEDCGGASGGERGLRSAETTLLPALVVLVVVLLTATVAARFRNLDQTTAHKKLLGWNPRYLAGIHDPDGASSSRTVGGAPRVLVLVGGAVVRRRSSRPTFRSLPPAPSASSAPRRRASIPTLLGSSPASRRLHDDQPHPPRRQDPSASSTSSCNLLSAAASSPVYRCPATSNLARLQPLRLLSKKMDCLQEEMSPAERDLECLEGSPPATMLTRSPSTPVNLVSSHDIATGENLNNLPQQAAEKVCITEEHQPDDQEYNGPENQYNEGEPSDHVIEQEPKWDVRDTGTSMKLRSRKKIQKDAIPERTADDNMDEDLIEPPSDEQDNDSGDECTARGKQKDRRKSREKNINKEPSRGTKRTSEVKTLLETPDHKIDRMKLSVTPLRLLQEATERIKGKEIPSGPSSSNHSGKAVAGVKASLRLMFPLPYRQNQWSKGKEKG
ncbi:hypothetical protein E2562_009807 [Oryza meyeriana var. granulata]|uniref:Uncharacterized protein n=1 Tax=Oryza meyeriana var. granulata TaxID=110450 RepID=A0A6G1BUE2_9ORYZ|nr:hypothetical protein E2562_009807 [Oryza meyeriana var. granulata]